MSDRTPGIRPRPTLWRRLDATSRAVFPAGCTCVLLLVLSAPLGLPAQAQLQPAAALACVFFWSLYRPGSMPPLAVFGLGLLCDLLGLAPVGSTVLTLLVAHGLAVRGRRVLARLEFVLVWLVFVCVAAGAAALEWALTSLLTWRLLSPEPAVFEAMVSAGIYPALATVFARAPRAGRSGAGLMPVAPGRDRQGGKARALPPWPIPTIEEDRRNLEASFLDTLLSVAAGMMRHGGTRGPGPTYSLVSWSAPREA